jgi:small subunit ribosomal protein S9
MVTTKKTPAKKVVAKKAPAKKVAAKTQADVKAETVKPKISKTDGHAKPAAGKYIFATGRRKTAVANVRLFAGTGDIIINKKAFTTYFPNKPQQDAVLRPFAVTGLVKEYYFVANVKGGGKMSQVGAVRHGVAQALAKLNSDLHNVLKKNGFLTRDDREKERKKPGLRRARRAPQWAKR